MAIETPHFDLPVRLAGGSYAQVEQDTEQDVRNGVRTVLAYRPDSRTDLPEFGVPDYLFGGKPDAEAIRAHVEEWEPRASATVEATIDEIDQAIYRLQITVSSETDKVT